MFINRKNHKTRSVSTPINNDKIGFWVIMYIICKVIQYVLYYCKLIILYFDYCILFFLPFS